ncbi:FkbM family methyltransferase [Pseudovibrio exalbescens]|uniref:FkbM family methyltransferase n=1 Tax=Pseudovibrio exalbescens TaxID=197461 RepID=UPI0011AF0A89|nr:FkbM family methyltransferase [Pseudovibrio exalbescens]
MRRLISRLLWAIVSGGNSRALLRLCLKLDAENIAARRQLYSLAHPQSSLLSKLENALALGLESGRFAALVERNGGESRAELFQDLVFFSLRPQGLKGAGYFVEVGLGDGVNSSNTFFMEHSLGWRGVLVEPNPSVADRIQARRTAPLDTRAAWHRDGEELEFLAAEGIQLYTLVRFAEDDHHTRIGNVVPVKTARLETVLQDKNAPDHIEFLSVDTEGSELEVLQGIDFNRRSFDFICVEHNFVEAKRDAVEAFLTEKGYCPIYREFSRFDAWYVGKRLQ